MAKGYPLDLINIHSEEEKTYIVIALRHLRKQLSEDLNTMRKADMPFNLSYASFLSERLVDIEKLIKKYDVNRQMQRQTEYFKFEFSEQ
ncbi:MAG: hypothetical protein AB9842_08275 [Bacteroidales bacterium]